MRILSFACAAGLLWAAVIPVRLSAAEFLARRDTVATLRRAVELDRFFAPAQYFERLAEIDPASTIQWLDDALQANPRLTSARIARGLAEERAREFELAEVDLLEAARRDCRYLPAWTLSNFYFRRGRATDFWKWAGRAATLVYDDYRPVLALAHAMEADPLVVLNKLSQRPALANADLDFLVQQGRLDEAQAVARLIISRNSSTDMPRIIELADRNVRAGRAREALDLWNSVAPPRAPRLDPAKGPALANGDFTYEPSGKGFDWILETVTGVQAAWRPSQVTVAFSGNQPEACALLEQPLALLGGRQYRLKFEYLTSGLGKSTGIRWDLDASSSPPIPASPDWRTDEIFFRSPGDFGEIELASLRLIYRREAGNVRERGEIRLRNFRMEPL